MICPTVSPWPPRWNSVKSQHVHYLSGKKSDSTLWLSFPFFLLLKMQLQLRFGWNIQGQFFFFFNQLKEHKISTFQNTTTLNTDFFWKMGSWHDTFVMDYHEMMRKSTTCRQYFFTKCHSILSLFSFFKHWGYSCNFAIKRLRLLYFNSL